MPTHSVKRFLICVAAVSLLTGCGDSPELRMQQAQIAMSNGKPDKALETINKVLQERPGDVKALKLKARAQMLLVHLDDSRETLDQLIKTNSDDAESRQLLVDWTWFRIRNVLSRSDFLTNPKSQTQFEEAMSTGQAQAEWLAVHEGRVADSHYYQARYANFDASRLRVLLQQEEKSISNVSLDSYEQTGKSMVSQRLKNQIEVRLDEVQAHLQQALEADTKHFKSAEMYAGLLMQRKRWSDLWVFAGQVAAMQEIPASTGERVVTALLSMPSAEQPKQRRLEMGQQIQEAVKKSHRDSSTWKMASAKLHLVAAQWDKAQPLLQAVLKNQPSNIEGQYFLAQSFYGMQEHEKAKAILEKLATRAPRSPQIQTLYGLVLMQTDEDMTLAKEALRSATELNPDDALAREAFLSLMAQEGHIEQAQGDIDEYLKRKPSDPRAIRFKLQFEQSRGRQDEVEQLLARTENIMPLTDEHLRVLIDGYMIVKKFDKAQRFARRLVRNRPDSIDSHLLLAEAMLMQGKDDQVKQMLVELRQQFPDTASVNQMLGKLYLQRQSYDRAIELLEKAVEAEPGNNQARVMLAQGLASLSLVDEALEQIDSVLEQDPGNVSAHALASRINQFMGKTEQANQHLAQIDESRINETTNPALLAQIKLKKGDIGDAEAVCNRAIAAGNSDPVLRMLLAGISIRKEDLIQAEGHLLALVRSQPKNRQAFALLTRFYLEQKMINKGLTELMELQVINEPLARLGQASLLRGVGQFNEALERIQPIYEPLVRERSPMAMMIADAMARVHLQRKDREAAYGVYQPLIEADLNAPTAMLRQIDLVGPIQPAEKTVEALNNLEARLTPDQRRMRYQVMRRFAGLGRNDRALEMVNGWIDQQPDQPTLLRWKGELLVQMGKPAEAIKAYQQAVGMAPESMTIRLKLAQAHVARFDYPSAEAVLVEAAGLDPGSKIVALASLGRMYVGIGLNHQAAATFDQLERVGRPSDPRVIFAMGQAYAALGQDDLARQRLADVPRFAPQYSRAQFLLARIEQRQGLVEESKKRLSDLARNPRTAISAIQELVAAKIRNRSVQDMINWSDKALSIESLPDPLRFRWLRVRIGIAANDSNWQAVLDALEEMQKLEPESLGVVASRIAVMIQLGQPEQARQLYRATPKLAESIAGPLLAMNLGETPAKVEGQAPIPLFLQALAQGDLDAARSAIEAIGPRKTLYRTDMLAVLDRQDAQSSNMAKACKLLGLAQVAHEYCRLPHLAEELCKQAIQLQPGLSVAYSLYTQALVALEKPTDNAFAQVRRAIPNSVLALFLSARDKSQALDFEGSAQDLQKLLEREPGNYHAHYNLTQVMQKAGQTDQAIASLQEFVKIDSPFQIAASNDLAYLLAENRPDSMDQAYQLASQSFEKAPTMTPLLDTIGWIEHLRGDNAKALAHLSRAIVGLSGIHEVHYHLGAVYLALDNPAWARYHLQEAAQGPADKPDVQKAKQLLAKVKK